jgi:hypothetical protein
MYVFHLFTLSSHDVYSFIVIVKQKEDKEHDTANALSAALAVDGVAGRTKRTIHHVAPFDASHPTPTKKPATPKKETKTSSKPPKNSDEKDMAHPPTKKHQNQCMWMQVEWNNLCCQLTNDYLCFKLSKGKTSLNLLLTSHVLSFV